MTDTVAQAARHELGRSRLLDFGALAYASFQQPPHVRFIAKHLEALERGNIPRLLVAVSVRHGKSVLCSQIFPAWFLGRNPRKEVVLASYASDLAERNSRVAKSFVEHVDWPFVGVRLSDDSKAVTRWNVTAGGGCRAIGVGGGITGRGADLLVIDDPHATATSEADREAAWEWYQQTITPRLNAGAREAVAEGITVYALDLNGPILERLLAAPHTMRPDALQLHPRAAHFVFVTNPTTIGSGPNRLVIYHIVPRPASDR